MPKFFHNFIRYIFISCCFQQYPPRHIHYITRKIIIQANAITIMKWRLNVYNLPFPLFSSIGFRPGPVRGMGSKFWPSHSSQLFFYKKNQNNIVLVIKKQKSTGCNRVFAKVLPDQPVESAEPSFSKVFFLGS
jgi:hypothetical protein